MPIYEFKCQNCGEITEKWQKMADPYPTECPICKKGKLQKIMSATGFSLKGGGWYVTDFKNKSGGSAGSTSTVPPTTTKEKSETSPAKEIPNKDGGKSD